MIAGWGPGLHQQIKLNGTGQMTFTELADFVHAAEARGVPASASVVLSSSDPDRPGERSSWSITVTWQEQALKGGDR